MAFGDFARSQLIEILEWLDDSRDTLSYRYPDQDREIKRGARLIVRESQAAQFVYLGEFGDTFGPGQYRLTTDNIPVLTRLRGWKYGFESPFKADVYFVTTRLFTAAPWGTSNPVMVRDPELGVVRLRAFGTYDFRVTDAARFLREVAGTDDQFQVGEFAEAMRARLVSHFSSALATSRLAVADIATRYRELGDALLPLINPGLGERYGVELAAFVVENVSVPSEVEQAIDKRAGIAAAGDLNAFVKYQMALCLDKEGTASAAGAQMGVGIAMAQQILGQSGGAAAAPVEVLTPAQVAQMLSVPEADVIASLEAGDLKGKRIGAAWRVTRAAVEAFLR